jgi:signal transduction histidine kinase
MSLLRRNRWFTAAAIITLAFAIVSLIMHKGAPLTATADLLGLALMLTGIAVCVSNAVIRPRQERSFWLLMGLAFALWTANQSAWTLLEVIQHKSIPDPFLFDIVLFFHVVPMIAAVAWRPDLATKPAKVQLSLLNFLMLFGWWVFLYAFIVFPHQYVTLNVQRYNTYYDALYGLENGLLVSVLVLAVLTSSGAWRRLFGHILAASLLYAINSQLLDRAAADLSYYSGSLYDVPLIATVAWITAAALSAREWDLATIKFNLHPRWKQIVPRMAMLAILSLPILGLWSVLLDPSAGPSRGFRIFAVLVAMIVLGAFVFCRQYAQDQALMTLLDESRRAYESQKQLQGQLVQREKLAALGNLIAGAARDINHPLNAIMSNSEELSTNHKLTPDQDAFLRKIVNQASRTRDLIDNLLSFAQQAPGEKRPVDLTILINRAVQMIESRRAAGKAQLRLFIEPDFPKVRANANQMFQAFVEIVENAMDALDGVSDGSLDITAICQQDEVVLQFSDNGPGLRDPERVFDPFYTTKPVGKGTGLGLSAVYGVIQDHGGQITCRNKPEGGALFIIKLPATTVAAQGAGAAG